ncbi:MAG: ferrous iron transport protein A [Sulfurospirillum sp.]|nr:ferrous iron transport protein A [Sulfurospirillum sp.]MBL0702972.1 ferrous iron transport protein A [Sulfurospirillum sp.]
MISLADLTTDEEAVILNVKAQGELKERLASFGLRKGSVVKVKVLSITKSTLEVKIGTGMIALRFEEAKKIEVERI